MSFLTPKSIKKKMTIGIVIIYVIGVCITVLIGLFFGFHLSENPLVIKSFAVVISTIAVAICGIGSLFMWRKYEKKLRPDIRSIFYNLFLAIELACIIYVLIFDTLVKELFYQGSSMLVLQVFIPYAVLYGLCMAIFVGAIRYLAPHESQDTYLWKEKQENGGTKEC